MIGKNDTSDEAKNQPQNRILWILYASLVFCRIFVCPFLPGYVHPDEFFQGGQELWFGCPPFVPWEFESQNALRSIFPPTLMTWLPLRIYALVAGRSSIYSLSGREILIVPRIFCGLLSILTVDLSIWHMTTSETTARRDMGPLSALLLVASAWPSLVLLDRPFTNSLETMLLALLLFVSTCMKRGYLTDLLMGILCAMGLFTRFTFVFVAMPTMLLYLRDKIVSLPISKTFGEIMVMATGFMLMSTCIVYPDLLYYNNINEIGASAWTTFVTPINAFLYNSQVENLKDHGLHPRWTHVVVNMLLLYGPLSILLYKILAKKILSAVSSTFDRQSRQNETETRIQTVCLWTVVSGLGFLSMAPHQEPRFLLPLLVPLAVVSRQCLSKSAWVRRVWVVFNAILIVFYGVMHQGRVVSSLMASSSIVSRETSPARAILYYHTYMPPTFASRIRIEEMNEDESCGNSAVGDGQGEGYCSIEILGCRGIPIVDLKGSPAEELLSALDEHLACDERGLETDDPRVYLVSPPLKIGSVAIGVNHCSIGASYACNHIQSFRPHVTTEDFPRPFDGSIRTFLSNLELSYYEVVCQ